jgi:Na+-transporting NADH:ubiquinone oxidoreductase subunit B
VDKPRPLFMKQLAMKRMLYALTPLAVAGIYFFGWRVLALLVVVTATGLLVERITTARRGQPISQACLVTCMLYGLSLPATTPWMVAIVGIVVAILFAKEVFGGFGRNFANPAIVGRAFVYVCFPGALTNSFVPVFKGLPGGFARWSFTGLGSGQDRPLPDYLSDRLADLGATGMRAADAVTQATPMWVKDQPVAFIEGNSWWHLFLGHIGGVFESAGQVRILSAGSIGEGSALLILISAAYLLWTKTANWRLMLGGLLGLAITNALFHNVLGFDGPGGVPPVHFNLLAGTTLYVLAFMITDPVSAPKKKPAQFAYAAFIGFLVVVLRWRNAFVAAASFSVLLGNCVSPHLDMLASWWQQRRKARAKAREARPEPTEATA